MYVKRLQVEELQQALDLAWEVFEIDVAPTYPEEGVAEFREFISFERMRPLVQSREVSFFGAMEGDQLCGISAIQTDGHIILLFVGKVWQRRGAARMLFYAMQQYCVIERAVVQMTVSATPNAVEAYKHLGFIQTNNEQMQDGIRYVPMAYVIKEAPKIITGGKETNTKRMGISFVLIMLGFLVTIFFGGELLDTVVNDMGDRFGVEEKNEPQKNTDKEVIHGSGNETGIDAIVSYQDENLSYTIKDEVYSYYSDGKSGEYPMEFEIHYPQLEGVDNEYFVEINQSLKSCAMSTVDALYFNPSQATKEAMIQQKNPQIYSQVTYKVTYATDEFISVVFNDHYAAGSQLKEYVDLRTRNFDLKNGTEYELKEIVTVSDTFMHEWKTRMKKADLNSRLMDEVKTSDLFQILNGKVVDGSYMNVWFVDGEGVQIGMTYHHKSGNTESAGWLTVPFSVEEIQEFTNESEFWNLFIDE